MPKSWTTVRMCSQNYAVRLSGPKYVSFRCGTCYKLVFCGATLNMFIHDCFTSQQQIPWLWYHMSLQVRCWRMKVRKCLLLAYQGQAHLNKKCLIWTPKTENLYCTLPGSVLSLSHVSHLFNFPHFTSEETEAQGNWLTGINSLTQLIREPHWN